ncbi:DoxX-like family protein [Mucilaginibacter sp. OK268]|uniref:DoxX family protein n=1 Tax=Mucilaginibacter sp. OK268 TaxID=1881048 RepID=UPI000882426F|nr:DoxX family protein [Mucilaginibacter sp. OK268]SDP49985.1 DoxX-like family protein [Mucilaginibacter sp. OK268]
MKKQKVVYWSITGGIIFFMLFSAYYAGTNAAEFKHLGFPNYFRIELIMIKIIGVVLLLIPQVNQRVREWIYVGFAINLFSAFVAKLNSGYSILASLEPLLVLVIILTGLFYLEKIRKTTAPENER